MRCSGVSSPRSPLLGVQPPTRTTAEMRTCPHLKLAGSSSTSPTIASTRCGHCSSPPASGAARSAPRWADVDLDAAVMSVRRWRVSIAWAGVRVPAEDPCQSSRREPRRARWWPSCARIGAGSSEERLAHCLGRQRLCVRPRERRTAASRDDHVDVPHDRRPRWVPKIRLHGLRHTSASLALAAGIHPKVVRERLGHSSVAITLEFYSHVAPALQAEAADKLGRVIFDEA